MQNDKRSIIITIGLLIVNYFEIVNLVKAIKNSECKLKALKVEGWKIIKINVWKALLI